MKERKGGNRNIECEKIEKCVLKALWHLKQVWQLYFTLLLRLKGLSKENKARDTFET